MSDILRSVGLDVGTTSTQMIFSELTVENKASGFAVPEMEIARRDIAEHFGFSVSKVTSMLRRTRGRLRQALEKEELL